MRGEAVAAALAEAAPAPRGCRWSGSRASEDFPGRDKLAELGYQAYVTKPVRAAHLRLR